MHFPPLAGRVSWMCVWMRHRGPWRVAVLGAWLLLRPIGAWGQSPTSIDGHVFHAEGHTPCGDALIQAWPCGATFSTDLDGRFEASCPQGVDSVTVLAHGHKRVTEVVGGRTHVDIGLNPLSVPLGSAEIRSRSSEDVAEAQSVPSQGDWMLTVDRVAGMRSLDVGAGLIQPVSRGLVGSRVAVLEDGVPQVGGRWGADHGVLVDPALYDGTEWVPGGGQLWLSPEAMGGSIRLRALGMLPVSGTRTQAGMGFRAGDGRSRLHVLHRERSRRVQWHAGMSAVHFGDRNVPQRSFQYLGRILELRDGRLPNTAGRGGHGVVGVRWEGEGRGQGALDLRVAEVVQGLFPGIIGVPTQSDLVGDGNRFTVDLPNQRAQRVQLAGKWVRPGTWDRTVRASVSRNLRIESAPAHAHGFGPEPNSDLSLRLEEWHGYVESRWEGIHGALGLQAEHLVGRTSGWEFLLPDHGRSRISAIADRPWRAGRMGLRIDGLHLTHSAHAEPLYAADGSLLGEDVRSTAMDRWMSTWALHVDQPFLVGARAEGQWTVTAYSRAPDSYSLGANGIHHGTFRFEQGQADLRPERTLEWRLGLNSVPESGGGRGSWSVRGFVALHDGFIHLTPTARFAPIAHAGQVYAFQALDAVRTGGEAEVTRKVGSGSWSTAIAVLGQWALETGLGLPFTPPVEATTACEWPVADCGRIRLRHRAIAAANLTARNEKSTPGASLWGLEFHLEGKRFQLALDVDNLFNAAWLDHVSAYRTLGLVTQGRWASLRITMDVTRGNAPL